MLCFPNERHYISQVFGGLNEYWYRYRKTWLASNGTMADQVTPNDQGYRHEWVRYDPGTGPELFTLDGVKATCFICADGEAPRCIERARMLAPQVVFYPNNRGFLPNVMDPGVGRHFDVFSRRAKDINAPMLVTNRIGRSWTHDCEGGCVVYSSTGEILARANRDGAEEILFYDLKL